MSFQDIHCYFSKSIFNNYKMAALALAVLYFFPFLFLFWASLIAQLVKNPPAMQETPI